jgi:hypothetical protein
MDLLRDKSIHDAPQRPEENPARRKRKMPKKIFTYRGKKTDGKKMARSSPAGFTFYQNNAER